MLNEEAFEAEFIEWWCGASYLDRDEAIAADDDQMLETWQRKGEYREMFLNFVAGYIRRLEAKDEPDEGR